MTGVILLETCRPGAEQSAVQLLELSALSMCNFVPY